MKKEKVLPKVRKLNTLTVVALEILLLIILVLKIQKVNLGYLEGHRF